MEIRSYEYHAMGSRRRQWPSFIWRACKYNVIVGLVLRHIDGRALSPAFLLCQIWTAEAKAFDQMQTADFGGQGKYDRQAWKRALPDRLRRKREGNQEPQWNQGLQILPRIWSRKLIYSFTDKWNWYRTLYWQIFICKTTPRERRWSEELIGIDGIPEIKHEQCIWDTYFWAPIGWSSESDGLGRIYYVGSRSRDIKNR